MNKLLFFFSWLNWFPYDLKFNIKWNDIKEVILNEEHLLLHVSSTAFVKYK